MSQFVIMILEGLRSLWIRGGSREWIRSRISHSWIMYLPIEETVSLSYRVTSSAAVPVSGLPAFRVDSIRSRSVQPEMNSSMTVSLPFSSQVARILGIPLTGCRYSAE